MRCCQPVKDKKEALLLGLEKERKYEEVYFLYKKIEEIYLEIKKKDLLIIAIYLEIYSFFLGKEKVYLWVYSAYRTV
ncbi:MAG: hypothetical protein D3914_01790 [Candidatus Electrothrix sp. LOE2]|nr:hypothetical protein [Candidatus Electrothrix sp. LOE2]